MMAPAAMVFLGSGLGGLLRYGVFELFLMRGIVGFPYATLTVNAVGGFVMGLCLALAQRDNGLLALGEGKAFLMIGILGGFTTFSTFSSDAFNLIEAHEYGQAAVYIAASVLLSLLGTAAGFFLLRGGAA